MIQVKVNDELLGTCNALRFDKDAKNLKLEDFDSDFIRNCGMELNDLISLRKLVYQFECVTGFKLDGVLLEKLASGKIYLSEE